MSEHSASRAVPSTARYFTESVARGIERCTCWNQGGGDDLSVLRAGVDGNPG